jgi:hypothetical protein
MISIINKYEKKMKECASQHGVYIHLHDAIDILRSALEEYRDIYKKDRRFDFWGNEIK